MHLVCIDKMANKNQPVRISKDVKDELKLIKQKHELRSIDAVLKKLLKKQARGDY